MCWLLLQWFFLMIVEKMICELTSLGDVQFTGESSPWSHILWRILDCVWRLPVFHDSAKCYATSCISLDRVWGGCPAWAPGRSRRTGPGRAATWSSPGSGQTGQSPCTHVPWGTDRIRRRRCAHAQYKRPPTRRPTRLDSSRTENRRPRRRWGT